MLMIMIMEMIIIMLKLMLKIMIITTPTLIIIRIIIQGMNISSVLQNRNGVNDISNNIHKTSTVIEKRKKLTRKLNVEKKNGGQSQLSTQRKFKNPLDIKESPLSSSLFELKQKKVHFSGG